VLNAIYEEDFLGFSYGFRRKRSQHDALDADRCDREAAQLLDQYRPAGWKHQLAYALSRTEEIHYRYVD
jgi:hypothetical protein